MITNILALITLLSAGAADWKVVPHQGASTLTWKGTVASSSKARQTAIQSSRWSDSKAELLTWDEGPRSFYAVSLNGSKVDKVSEASKSIRLRYREFDPLASVPTVAPDLEATTQNEWFIVQFKSQPLEQFHHAIQTAGGYVHTYLADNALICRLDPAALDFVSHLDYVRWVGPYRPAYRIDPSLLVARDLGRLGRSKYMIQVSDWSGVSKSAVAQRIQMIGGEAIAGNGGSFMVAMLTPDQLVDVASWNEVFYIDLQGEAGEDMDIVRAVGGANYIESLPENYKGQGVRGEVMDGNTRTTHNDFANPSILVRTAVSGSTSHGTSTFGIVFGNGSANAMGRGLLPFGQGIFASYTTLQGFGGSTSRYASTQQMISAPYSALFQSNSWGSSQVTSYTNASTEMDQIIKGLDVLILNSQSNTGNQTSRPEAWAKNILSIGGITHQNTATLTDDMWTGASFGPAEDGRIKPDICHWYDNIFCPTSTNNTAYTTGFNGTSAATPIVAGHAGLWYQLWADGVFGNSVAASTPFTARPHYTLSKAWMINQATPYPITTTNTRYRQGWGLAMIKPAYDNRDRVFFVDETDLLANLQTRVYRVYVPSGTPEFKATMVYSDLPGTTSSTQHRINDLSLKVTSPSGTVYWGNNGLISANVSASGSSSALRDTKNNVENVFLTNPAAGTYLVEVSGDAITMDAFPGTAEVDSNYALVVSGVSMSVWPTSTAVTYGMERSGQLSDMKTSNNRRFEMDHPIEWNDVFNDTIRQEVSSVLPFSSPSQLKFKIELFNLQANVSQEIEFFDYTTNNWVMMSTSSVGAGDNFFEVNLDSNIDRFIRVGTREVKARMTWYQMIINDVDWYIGMDQVRWNVTP